MLSTLSNVQSKDRILVLEKLPGKPVLNSAGAPDNRLFTGEQNVMLKMDPETCLWSFQYTNQGLLPEGLKGKFTGFKAGLKHAESYFQKRNVKIVEVKS